MNCIVYGNKQWTSFKKHVSKLVVVWADLWAESRQKQKNHLLNKNKRQKKFLPFPLRPLILRKEEGHKSSMKPSNNLLISIIKSLDWNRRLSALLSYIILPKFLFAILTVVRWKPLVFVLITKSTFPLYQFTASLLNAVHLISLALPAAHSGLHKL